MYIWSLLCFPPPSFLRVDADFRIGFLAWWGDVKVFTILPFIMLLHCVAFPFLATRGSITMPTAFLDHRWMFNDATHTCAWLTGMPKVPHGGRSFGGVDGQGETDDTCQ